MDGKRGRCELMGDPALLPQELMALETLEGAREACVAEGRGSGGGVEVGTEDFQGSDHVGSKVSSERSEGQHQGSVRVGSKEKVKV